MKVYVAGKYENISTVRYVQTLLIEAGHEISHDWTTQTGDLSHQAAADIMGVQDGDAFVGIFLRKLTYRGALAELGGALALGKRVIIMGHGADRCIFTHHPAVQRFERLMDFENYVKEGNL